MVAQYRVESSPCGTIHRVIDVESNRNYAIHSNLIVARQQCADLNDFFAKTTLKEQMRVLYVDEYDKVRPKSKPTTMPDAYGTW